MIPETVKIGGLIYKVELVDMPDPEDADCNGLIVYRDQSIKIRKGMGKDYTELVLIHEMFHGITEHLHISWGDENEHVVSQVAAVLYQTLKDNKKLIE